MANARTPKTARARSPSRAPTLVLVVVTGLTPQVVTETLYVLRVRDRYRGPIEVHVLTTQAGRDAALRRLLDPSAGALHRFCRDYRIPAGRIVFPPEHIHVLRGAAGRPLADIRSSADNAAVADQIATFVRDQTARPDVIVHGSIAGGRKTMSMLLGTAFILFGRPLDRLSHVLVSSEFENSPAFFYPLSRPTHVRLADGRTGDASGAQVDLAEIEFPRLRDRLTPAEVGGSVRYADLVRSAQARLDEAHYPELVVDLKSGDLRIGTMRVPLAPRLLAFYSLFAAEKVERCVRRDLRRCGPCTDCYFSAGKAFPDEQWERLVAVYRHLRPRNGAALSLGVKGPYGSATRQELKSKVNEVLRHTLGPQARPYLVTATGAYAKEHGLPIDKGLIRLRYPAPGEALGALIRKER